MTDLQSIQTTTDSSNPAPTTATGVTMATAATTLTRPSTVTFVDRDLMATCHASRGWTLPVSRKSSQETLHKASKKTSEGDSNTLDDFRVQDTKSEVTSAISA